MTAAERLSGWRLWLVAGLGALGAIALGLWLTGRSGSGTDYYFTFHPLALHWLAGQAQLYGPAAQGFYHPPWALWAIVPFALLPYQLGLILLTAVSASMVVAGAIWFSAPGRSRPWALAFALFNLHTFDLLYRGQLSGFEVVGVGVGWVAYRSQNAWLMGLAYCLMSLVPPNTIPVAVFLAWLCWRDWPRRRWMVSLALPAGVGLLSLVSSGWWPGRWLANLSAKPAQPFFLTTLWRMADQLALPPVIPWGIALVVIAVTIWAWRRAAGQNREDVDLSRLMLLIVATLVVTPYSLSYRLVLLTACVMPFLARWRPDVLVGLYLLTFLPLARLAVGRDNSWIDLGFVFAVYIAVVTYVAQARPEAGAGQE